MGLQLGLAATVLMKKFIIIWLFTYSAVAIPPVVMLITREAVYVRGEFDRVYNVDIAIDATLKNWAFATNFIGQSTNSPPEIIDFVTQDTNKIYRVHSE